MAAAAIGHNGRTREEFLHAILHSGEVTRVGQHLALVLYHISDTASNIAKLSMRDLEKTTGWGRQTILDHLSEIHMFFKFLPSRGRAKSSFEMQGAIEQYVNNVRCVRHPDTTPRVAAATIAACVRVPDTSCVRVPDTKTIVRQPDTTLDTTRAVYDSRARALAATVAKNEDHDVGTLSSSLSCSTTVIVEGQTPALPMQLENEALQQQPAAIEPNASSSEATHLDLVASLRAIDDARTAEDTLHLSEVYAARRDLLWPKLTAEAQASLTREQDQLRPMVKRRLLEAKRAHAVLPPTPTSPPTACSMDFGNREAALTAKFGEAQGEFARARSAGVLSALRAKYDWLWTALPAALAVKLESAFAAQMTALGGGMSLFDGGAP